MQNNKKLTPVIINCDDGIDDVTAIILAANNKKTDIKLIVLNLEDEGDKSTQHLLNIFELINVPEIPICLANKNEKNRIKFNDIGFEFAGYEIKNNKRKISTENSIELMYKQIMSSDQKVTIVSIAPATEIARLINEHSDCKDKIEKIIIVSGIGDGNSYNMGFDMSADLDATNDLLSSDIQIVIVPKNIGKIAYLDWENVYKTKTLNLTGEILEWNFRRYNDEIVKNGIALYDAFATAYLINPEIFEAKQVNAEIDKNNLLVLNNDEKSNILVCTDIDKKRFIKQYFNCLKKCK